MSLTTYRSSLESEFGMEPSDEVLIDPDGENTDAAIMSPDKTVALVDPDVYRFLDLERRGGETVENYQLLRRVTDDENDYNWVVRVSAGVEIEDDVAYLALEKVGRAAKALNMEPEGLLQYMDWWFCMGDDNVPVGFNLIAEGWLLIAPIGIDEDQPLVELTEESIESAWAEIRARKTI